MATAVEATELAKVTGRDRSDSPQAEAETTQMAHSGALCATATATASVVARHKQPSLGPVMTIHERFETQDSTIAVQSSATMAEAADQDCNVRNGDSVRLAGTAATTRTTIEDSSCFDVMKAENIAACRRWMRW